MVVNGAFHVAHILKLTLDKLDTPPFQCWTDRNPEDNSKTDDQEEEPNDKLTA